MFITFTLIGQAFIQTVLLMPVFEQRLDFSKVAKYTWGSRDAESSARSSWWHPGEGSEG